MTILKSSTSLENDLSNFAYKDYSEDKAVSPEKGTLVLSQKPTVLFLGNPNPNTCNYNKIS